MCSFGSSNNSAPTSQYSTQTTVAAPQAQAMYNQAWANAQKVGQRPFQPYSYDPNAFAAPMNSTQLTAVNNLYQQQNAGQPFYQAAPAMAYSAGNTNAAGLAGAYMSPYLDSVAASTMGWLNQQQAQQQNQLAGQIAKNGQWGNDRSGIERAILAGQQNMATNSAMSNLYNQGYNTALGAAQTDLTRQLQAAQNLAGQGQTATGSLLQAGTLGQQTQQKGLEGLYNQYMMQQQYPFQVAQFLASTAAGLGPGYGSTTSGMQSSQQPLSFFGNPLSDPHLKVGAEGDEPEVIGQTNDGQDIYRYRVINPDTGDVGPVQIGLMADEVQQRRPDAIGDYKGYRTVDYAKATDDAARLGGGVKPTGGDYAEGGPISIVPQDFKMPTAHLDTPTLHFMTPPAKEKSNLLGDLGSSAKNLLDLYKTGKEAKSIYDDWGKGDSTMASDASGRASGGLVYGDPELRQGPGEMQMPTAKLNTPELSYAYDKNRNKNEEGGIGSAIKDAAGIAGSLKTLWDIGSTVGPMLMSLSDRRLKTGVRPARENGGKLSATDLFDYLVNEKGADPREAAVLTSGAGVESNFNPNAVHDKGTGYGLWGHRLDRYDAMKRFTGEDRPGWHGQADFALDEFRRRPEHKMAMSSNDPEALTRAQMFYERPAGFSTAHPEAGRYYDRRLALTQQLLGGDRDKGLGAGVMALAAPEGRPRNGGLDAIDAATRGRGVVPPAASPVTAAASEDMAPAQGISGMIRGKPASGLGERALDFATSERFLVPFLSGLGAMASSGSRYLAPAILQGLGAGAQAYMEVPKVQSEIMKNTLGIAAQRFKPLENGNFYDNVLGREVSSQERGSAISGMFSGTLGGVGGIGGASAATPYSPPSEPAKAPEIDAATRTAKEVSTPTAPPPVGTEPPTKAEDTGASGKVSEIMTRAAKDPSVMALMQKANNYEAEANRLQKMPYVEGASERASAYRSLAQQYRSQALDIRNKIAEPDIAAVKTEQEKKIASKYETVTVEPAPGEPARIVTKDQVITGAGVPKNAPVAKQPEAVAKQQAALAESKVAMAQNAQARQNVRERLNTLKDILSTYETGKFAEQKADLVATMRAIGIPVSDTDTSSPEKFQEFVKNATATIFQQAAGLGGPVLKSELEGLAKANPNPTMQPGANRQILGQALGLLDWEDKHYNDFVDWTEKNPYAYDASKFERDWLKANPTKGYVKKATLGIAAKGEAIPPRDKLEIGYTTVRDGVKWQWDGKQFVRVK